MSEWTKKYTRTNIVMTALGLSILVMVFVSIKDETNHTQMHSVIGRPAAETIQITKVDSVWIIEFDFYNQKNKVFPCYFEIQKDQVKEQIKTILETEKTMKLELEFEPKKEAQRFRVVDWIVFKSGGKYPMT